MPAPAAMTNAWRDAVAGLVVFLVALPLCLGVALASGAPLLSGVIAGIVGGLIVGALSGSHTSVSGPAAGLSSIVAAQIASLGSFDAFLTALFLAGLIQIGMGIARAGFIAHFFPSSVIKGLLAAIGIIIILKQIPHLVGHDPDPEGDLAFFQPDNENTFTELIRSLFDLQPGACAVGFASLLLLIVWDRSRRLKHSPVPAPLVVVVVAVLLGRWFQSLGEPWAIEPSHMVQVPVFDSFSDVTAALAHPATDCLDDGAIWLAAVTIAIVASLETLLNLEAVDKLDPKKRVSPANRELLAQGCGNVISATLGGLPVTSVIVRSSVNINAGAQTRLSAITHGGYLAGCVLLLPALLNQIPLACLAAILIMTGVKLASWKIIKSVYKQGWAMFLPFIVTVVAIVFTDLIVGILIGLAASVYFIMRSNIRRPVRRILEKHVGGDVLHFQLANQVSFLNRAMLTATLDEIPSGGHVLIDARDTDYIDPDIVDLIRTYVSEEAPARGVNVSLLGFHEHYHIDNRILFADFTSREVRDSLTPDRVLQILKDGHERFLRGERLFRDHHRQMLATAGGQAPLAAVLACIDSRTPTEIIFDLGLGDVFTVRIAGNVAKEKVLGSLEYATRIAGAKLILVLGHTRCGAVTATVDLLARGADPKRETRCEHLDALIGEIGKSVDRAQLADYPTWSTGQREAFVDDAARRNVRRTVQSILASSQTLRDLVDEGQIKVIGAHYDIKSGQIEFDP